MVQMESSPVLAAAAFGALAAAPSGGGLAAIPGVQFDSRFSPVPIPRVTAGTAGFAVAAAVPAPSTYVVRAAVDPDRLDDFLTQAGATPGVVGVFGDPRIEPIAPVCPFGPVGTDLTVEGLLDVPTLKGLGMDGTGVRVVVVDTGVNTAYLAQRGKHPVFDAGLSWAPQPGLVPGSMPVDHGTMCAYDVCIAAPNCTMIDHAVLSSTATGGSVMEGLLSDAVQSYGVLLSFITQAASPFAGDHTPRTLVVNNSWGMFHPSWDFPVNNPQNYSDNPDHPFNIIVGSLAAAGADILFAAGNCGTECPDGRCQGLTTAGIFGANSHASVLAVAGVKTDGQRIGYSTKGPGRLEKKKPDIASYTHFAGSGVYTADGGTSAATPVAAGVVAAVRRVYPASVVPSARLRDLIRETAKPKPSGGFDYATGHGTVNVPALLAKLEAEFGSASPPPSTPPPKKKPRPKK
jgi:subtilisin family serine protease